MIDRFQDGYFFLNNFYPCAVEYRGIQFRCAEAAFQAQKCRNEGDKARFAGMNATEARNAGRAVSIRPDWEAVKVSEMRAVVKAKFAQNPELCQALLDTGDAYLEEGNTWGDRTWGTVDGRGANLLGQILMEAREGFREQILEEDTCL